MTIAPVYAGAAGEDEAEAAAAWAGNLPEWRLLVAPLAGTFRTAPEAPAGAPAVVGHIDARGDRRAIIPPWPGPIIEWLVQDGDPVSPGQPLARLLPDGAE